MAIKLSNVTIIDDSRNIVNASNIGIGTTDPTQSLDVVNGVRLRGALYDGNNEVGTGTSVLLSTGSGIIWTPIATAALQGVQGTQGLQGLQGLQGIQGIQGVQGTQGLQGIQGVQGTQGLQGLQGLQGIQGVQGTQGLQGIQGVQGTQGLQGIQGVQGVQGTQGLQGLQGLQGIQGVQGTQGLQGLQGIQGVQGVQGTQGLQGLQGIQGVQGTQGLQGIQGITGPVAGAANQVVFKDGSNDPTGSANLTFNGATLQVGGVSGTGIGINTNTISGPSVLFIDPAALGDNTGAVRILGDLFVDGTQTYINSTTVEIADLLVGIGTTATSDLLLDGAGIGIGSIENRKTFVWNNTSTSLKSSENVDIAAEKTYKINGTDVLSATTLGTGVTNSSLTSVGSLTNLNVLGVITSTDYNSTSDVNLKTNIQPIFDPIEKIMQINGVTFDWKEDSRPSAGIIAQEVEKVLPELVSSTNPKTVNYNGLIGLLIEGMKFQQRQIEELKSKPKRTRKPKEI